MVPEPLQLERLEPDGSGGDVWVRYRLQVALLSDLLLSPYGRPVGM